MLGIRYDAIETRPIASGDGAVVIPADEFWSEEFRFVREELRHVRERRRRMELLVAALQDRANFSSNEIAKESDGSDGQLSEENLAVLIEELRIERLSKIEKAKRGGEIISEKLYIDDELSEAGKWEVVKALVGGGLLKLTLLESPLRKRGRPKSNIADTKPVIRAQIVNESLELARARGHKIGLITMIRALARWSSKIPPSERDWIASNFVGDEASLQRSVSEGRTIIEENGLPRTFSEGEQLEN